VKRNALLCVAVCALVTAGCGTTTKTVTRTVTAVGTGKADAGPPGQVVQFGYVKSLVRSGGRYRMHFDPALMLSGETANVAAAQDGLIQPGEPVPNDNYVVNEGKRLFMYFVAPDARVTVLKKGPQGTPVTVEQLARLVSHHNPPFKLFEPLTTGFWIVVNIDTVRALDQQYRP
jgi:hypothetical protein